MSKAPSMPMYWDAYLADTTHLTTEEHGAYMLLLGAMWRRNGWVPDDDRDNARILGLTVGKWRKIKARLSGFLIFREGEISQKKLLEIWKNTQEKIEKNRANGAKGGRPKSKKNNDLAKANGYVSDNPNETIPEPEPEPYIREPSYEGSLSSGDDPSAPIPKPVDDIAEAVAAYNDAAAASGWPKVRILSKARRAALAARLRECDGIAGWRIALEKAQASNYLCGGNGRGWVANFDFLTRQSSFAKIMEGNYDNRIGNGMGTGARGGGGMATAFAEVGLEASRSAGGNGTGD